MPKPKIQRSYTSDDIRELYSKPSLFKRAWNNGGNADDLVHGSDDEIDHELRGAELLDDMDEAIRTNAIQRASERYDKSVAGLGDTVGNLGASANQLGKSLDDLLTRPPNQPIGRFGKLHSGKLESFWEGQYRHNIGPMPQQSFTNPGWSPSPGSYGRPISKIPKQWYEQDYHFAQEQAIQRIVRRFTDQLTDIVQATTLEALRLRDLDIADADVRNSIIQRQGVEPGYVSNIVVLRRLPDGKLEKLCSIMVDDIGFQPVTLDVVDRTELKASVDVKTRVYPPG